MDRLVSTDWLANTLGAPDLVILDASTHLDPGRDARLEFDAARIPGARFLDLKAVADLTNPLPMMLPAADDLGRAMAALGIARESRIVLYDDSAIHSAARGWWMLHRVFGLPNVALLDGGLAAWCREARALDRLSAHDSASAATVAPRKDLALDRNQVRTLVQVHENLTNGQEQLIDARSAARFAGEEAETRAGLASGHIPGSRNLPYATLFEQDGRWKRGAALQAAFDAAAVDRTRPLVATCGSGVTAACLVFAAELLGKTDVALYDGSWTEWGGDRATPKATGPA